MANPKPSLGPLQALIFSSRWLQLPLYLGLIVAQGVYVVQFLRELWHLLETTFLHGGISEAAAAAGQTAETSIMLTVIGLIDVVMISNLLVMVIVGGYETFVSRLGLEGHPDQPEWLSHVNAAVLKVKLATAIIGISSIHLLATFIKAEKMESHVIMWQVVLHLTFVVSALVIALIDRVMTPKAALPSFKSDAHA
ncbi:MAG: TIGR00645 family protein [Tahibacter sp.]